MFCPDRPKVRLCALAPFDKGAGTAQAVTGGEKKSLLITQFRLIFFVKKGLLFLERSAIILHEKVS